MITVQNVSFSYCRSSHCVFDDFSFSLEKGKVYGLLGRNGAGKSTLLSLLSGLLFPQRGQILFHDTDVRKRKPVTSSDLFLVPEEFDFPKCSLDDYVKVNSVFYPRYSGEDMSKYLHLFEIDGVARLNELSMGQKKKVFMSFALATNTSFLLMDEPSNGLDIPSKSQFRKFIASGITDEKIILISTHQVHDVETILDHILILNNSKILLNESINDIAKKLIFAHGMDPTLTAEALYSLPSLQGNSYILPNNEGRESEIDLEMLFNATLSSTEEIVRLFNSKN